MLSDRAVPSDRAFPAPSRREALAAKAVFERLVPDYRAAERPAERSRRGEER